MKKNVFVTVNFFNFYNFFNNLALKNPTLHIYLHKVTNFCLFMFIFIVFLGKQLYTDRQSQSMFNYLQSHL